MISLVNLMLLLVITIGHYLYLNCFKTLQPSLKLKPFKTAFVLSIVVFTLMMLGRYYWPNFGRHFLNYLGWLNYAFITAVVFFALHSVLESVKKTSLLNLKWCAPILLAVPLIVSGVGFYNFHKPHTIVEFEIPSSKITQDYRLVHLSDIQYGSISKREMNHIFETAYKLKPDLIVFTGDLVDFNHFETNDFSILRESPAPIFYVRGNHEHYHQAEILLETINKIPTVSVLNDQTLQFKELFITGLDFHRDTRKIGEKLQQSPLTKENFNVLLYHEPVEVERAVQHGFDLQIYAHTHGGQMWPFTWIVDAMYEYSDGAYKLNDSFVYTSDGAALWGPRLRLGSQNEITLFKLRPNESSSL